MLVLALRASKLIRVLLKYKTLTLDYKYRFKLIVKKIKKKYLIIIYYKIFI